MQRVLRFCSDHLLVLVTLSFLAGAVTAGWCAHSGYTIPPPTHLLPLLILPPGVALLLAERNRLLAPFPFFFLVGFLHTTQGLQLPSNPQHIANLIQHKTEATVVGRMVSMPEFNGKTTHCVLACEALLLPKSPEKGFQPVHGRLRLIVAGELAPSVRPGGLFMARATLDQLHRYQTPGAFNYPLQMATRSIYTSAWLPSKAALEQILPAEKGVHLTEILQSLASFPQRIRQDLAKFLAQNLPREHAGIYQALLTGTLAQVSSETLELFKVGGVFHLLAISGLHFSLLGLFFSSTVLFLLKRSQWILHHTHAPTLALVITAPLLLLYACIAGLNLPAFRALITALLVLVAIFLQRQRSVLPLISAAALLVLTFRPLALFTASFQLSFAAVLAINLIYQRLPIFTPPVQQRTHWQQLTVRCLQVLQSMLYVSLAATAGTLPILLFHFNRLSLVGPFSNLLIEPLLCLWALPWGLAAACILPLSPHIAQWCLKLGDWGVQSSLYFLHHLQHLPQLSWWTITPTVGEILGYYLLLYLLIARPAFPQRLYLTCATGLALIVSHLFLPWSSVPTDTLRIDYLDVGQGTATLIRLPEGETILLDGGGFQSDRFNIGESLIAPFLWHERIRHLDRVIITHPHGDHYNGLPFILSHFQPKDLVINSDSGQESEYTNLLAQANLQGMHISRPQAGDILYQDSQVCLRCLGMPGLQEKLQWNTNDRSLVFLLTHHQHQFLFPADIGHPSEEVLLQANAHLRAQVLLAPHHGSKSSSSGPFIQAVTPQWIIVSSGRNRWGILPAREHLKRWQQEKRVVLPTAKEGTIQLTSRQKSLCARTFSGKELCLPADKSEFSWQNGDLKERKKTSMLIY